MLFANLLYAGTTGKITGKVVDKETHDPLPGVNVMVQGTTLGASTGLDGYYVILNVPPGNQTIVASMVGYATVTVTDVSVRIDQTSNLDIELTPQAIQATGVEVIAERKIIRRDVSASESAVQPEEITALPVTTLNDVVGLQAGVENGMIVRGGSIDQLLLQVDGVTRRDPRNNQPISNIALSSIQEVSIERGGFNAEYGQVRSGLINIVEKEGNAAHYFGSINTKYSPPQQKYFGISEFDPNSMWNRPYMDPAVCWTGTGNGNWSQYMQNQYPQFEGWDAVSQSLLQQGVNLSPAACQRIYEYQHRREAETNQPDYNIDASFGGPIPIISHELGDLRFFTSFVSNREMLLIPLSRPDYRDYNWSIKINSDISSKMKLMLSASTGKSYNVAINATDAGYYNQAWLSQVPGTSPFWNPADFLRTPDQIAGMTYEQRSSRVYTDSWYSTSDVSDYTFSGKLTNFVTASTFYEISAEGVHRSYLTGPIALRDTAQLEIVPGYWINAEAPSGYSPQLLSGLGDPGLFFGGHSSTAHDSSEVASYTLKGDITSQVNEENLVKAGLEFSYYDLRMNYGTINPVFSDVNWVKQSWSPYRLSAFVQDKIEVYGFIANLGLRLDLSNPNTDWVQVNPFDVQYFSSAFSDTVNYAASKVKPDVSLSPRLGISHPITESSKLYFNYGHFKEFPAYEETFRMGRAASGGMVNYGDPNLSQAKTISYQLGFDQSIADAYLLQLAAFYNDITDQQAFTFYESDQKGINYYAANNNSYSDVRGLEVTLRKNTGDWIQGFVNYTYQVVRLGQFGQVVVADNPALQRESDESQSNALYQQISQRPVPQPRANASIMFLTPKDFGPKVAGITPLGDWIINVVGMWKAGEWLTYNPQNVLGVANNVQVTDYTNINLRINKTFDFKVVSLTFFLETTNLLNEKLLSGESFYDNNDFLAYMGSLHLPSNPAYNNTNIPGNDRIGDYRMNGANYQPVLFSGNVYGMNLSSVDPTAIYWDKPTGKYMQYANGNWQEVDQGHMQRILDDKAYIDMPNNSSFDFLNPRQFYYGINLSFNF